MSEYKLTNEIIGLSQSKVWDTAKLEWSLSQIYEADEPERCLCGHFPIIEICILQNKFNSKETPFATIKARIGVLTFFIITEKQL